MQGRLIILALLAATAASAFGPAASAADTLVVGPGGYESIQDAVDAAAPGDTVLIMPGVYQEEVFVTTRDVTIRGWDRESVVLDGGGVLGTAIQVNADGVSVESLTVKDYDNNGIQFANVDGFRIFDAHSIRARVYGLYAIHSVNGEIAYSFAEGSGDGGLYIGETPNCDCDVHHNKVWGNALGYSGTANSYVRIWENEFFDNRVGILMNVLPNEMGIEDDGTIYGTQVRSEIYNNYVHDNNNKDSPLAGFTTTVTPPYGVGIQIAGGWFNDVHHNVIENNDFAGVLIHWLTLMPRGNHVHDNVIDGSRWGIWWDEWGEDHCFSDNFILNAEYESDPNPLPTCPGPAGDVDCPAALYDWLACRASDVRAPSVTKEVELAWRTFTLADPEDDLYPPVVYDLPLRP